MKYIFTADWHIRSDNPICRVDDFLDIQKKILLQIRDIAFKENACILVAGDIFDKARIEPYFEIMLIDIFKRCEMYVVAGNHELLYHRLDNIDKSSLGVLIRQDNWTLLQTSSNHCFDTFKGFSYGENIENGKNLVLLHKYCEMYNLPDYIENGITAEYLCNNYDYDIFVTGDNHHSFVYAKKNKIVFNPGCITRQNVNLKKYQPVIFLYDSTLMKYEKIQLLDNDIEAIDDSYLKIKKQRDERVELFLNKLNIAGNMDVDFISNLRKFLKSNSINQKTRDKIWEIVN